MQKTKTFHNLLIGISVLPALMIMPAMATEESTAITTPIILEAGADIGTDAEKIEISTTDNRAIWVKDTTPQDSVINIGNMSADIVLSTTGNSRAVNMYRGTTNLTGKDIQVYSETNHGIAVLEKGILNIDAETVNIKSDAEQWWAAVHSAGNGKGSPEITINADDIDIVGQTYGMAAMSGGKITINGDTHIEGKNNSAIVTRGDSVININTDGEHTTKIDGDIDFNYDAATSGTGVNAKVNVNLTGEDSYWNGNTISQYSVPKPSDDKLAVDGMALTVKDGATWNATKVEDSETKSYIALNNLNVDGGIVNIKDTDRGITVDNATVANATFNGGSITINDTMTVDSGTSVFNSDILGVDGLLVINDGATLNIADSIIDVDTINLNGKLVANLTDRGDKAIVTAEQFGGDGILSLIAKNGGNYKVFGNAVFGGEKEIQTESAVYNLDWNEDGTVNLELKTVEDIAEDNNLSAAASQTVSNLVNSTSDKLNDFGLLAQESLSNGDSAAVEKAHKAINPEETSVLQSVASHIQGTVSKLAGNRMSESANGVWATGLFNKSKLNGGFNGYNRGISAGIDGTKGAFTLGAGYAFNHSDFDLNSRDTEIDSNTIFAYGQYKPSKWYVNGTVNYTMSDYTEKGSALGMAIDSDYKANSFGGQVMTGYDFANGFTPETGVRYMHIAGDTYTNSLGIKNKIDSADYLTAILGGKYAKSFAISEGLNLKPEVRLAAKYDLMSDEAVTTVSMPGIAKYSVNGDRLNRFGGEAGLGVTMSYKDVDLSLTYDIEVRKDYTSQTGMLKAKYNF